MRLGSPLLSAIPGLRHTFFTREGGVSGGIYASLNGGLGSRDDPASVAENRRRMAEQIGVIPEHFLSVHQTHSPNVVVASGPWQGVSRPLADAIVTRNEGLAIGATAADCGPILLVDPSARVIGAAHAGWKGALTGIVESTVEAMEQLGAERSGLHPDAARKRRRPDDRRHRHRYLFRRALLQLSPLGASRRAGLRPACAYNRACERVTVFNRRRRAGQASTGIPPGSILGG